nr:adhesion protein 2 [Theama mediterranea]
MARHVRMSVLNLLQIGVLVLMLMTLCRADLMHFSGMQDVGHDIGDNAFDDQAPTTAKPTTAKPTTAKPTTAKPTTARPTTARPTTAKPTTAKPTTAKPTTAKPTTAKPTTAKPTTAKPTTAKPTTAKPTTAKPTTVKPTTAKPTTAKPTTAKPTTSRPTTAKPTPAKHTTAEPTTTTVTNEIPNAPKPFCEEGNILEDINAVPTPSITIKPKVKDVERIRNQIICINKTEDGTAMVNINFQDKEVFITRVTISGNVRDAVAKFKCPFGRPLSSHSTTQTPYSITMSVNKQLKYIKLLLQKTNNPSAREFTFRLRVYACKRNVSVSHITSRKPLPIHPSCTIQAGMSENIIDDCEISFKPLVRQLPCDLKPNHQGIRFNNLYLETTIKFKNPPKLLTCIEFPKSEIQALNMIQVTIHFMDPKRPNVIMTVRSLGPIHLANIQFPKSLSIKVFQRNEKPAKLNLEIRGCFNAKLKKPCLIKEGMNENLITESEISFQPKLKQNPSDLKLNAQGIQFKTLYQSIKFTFKDPPKRITQIQFPRTTIHNLNFVQIQITYDDDRKDSTELSVRSLAPINLNNIEYPKSLRIKFFQKNEHLQTIHIEVKGCFIETQPNSKNNEITTPKPTSKPKNKQPKNKKKRKPSEKAKKPTKRPPLKPHATGFNWPPFSFPKACKPKDVIDNDSIKSSDIKIETETAGKKKGARRGKGGKGGKVATTRPDANKLKRKSPQGLEVKPEQTKTVISFEIKKKPTNALKEAKLILVSDDKKKENEEKEIQCLHKVAVDLSFGDDDDDDDKDDGKDKGRDKKNKKEKQKRKRKKSGKQQKSKKKQQEISIVKEGKEITAAFLNDVFEGKAGAPSAIKITIIRDVKKCKKKSLHVKLSIKGCAHSKSSPSGQAKKPKPTSKPKKKKKARKPSKKQPTKRPKKTSKPKEKPKKKKKRPSKTAKPTKKPKKAKKPKNKQPKNKKKRKPSEKAKKPTKRPPLKPHATGFNWPPFSFPKACKPKDVIDNDSIKSSDIKIETETAGKKKGARRGKGGKGGKVATTRPDANKLKRKSPQGLEVKPEQTKTVISFEIKKKPTNALKEAKLILVSDDKKKENEEKEIQCLHKVAVDLSFGDSSDDDDDKDDGKDKGRDKKNKKEKQKRKRKKSGKQQKSKKKQQEISIVKEGKEITAAFLNDVFEGKAGAPSAIKITIIRDVKKCKKKSLHVKLSIKGCAHSKSSPSGQAKKPKPTSKPKKKKKKARKPSKKQPTKRPKKTSKPKEKPKKKKKRPSKTAKPTKKPKKAKKPKNKQPKNKKKRKPSEKAKKPTKRPPLKPHATGFKWPPFSFPKACKPKDVIDNDSIKSSDIKIETETAGKKKGARRGKGGKGGKVATTRPDANKLKRKSPQGLEVKPEQTKTVISFEIKKKPTNALKEAKLILVSDDKKKENEEKEIQCLHKVAVDLSFGDSSDDDDDKDDGKDKGRDKKNKKEKQKRKRKKSGKQQKSKKKQQEISIVKEGKEITAAFLNDVFEGKAGAPSAIKITIIRDVKKCKKKSLHVKLSIKGCAHSKSSPSGQAKKPKPTSKPKKKKKARKPSKKQPTKRPKKTSKPKEKPKKKKKRPSKTAKPTKKPKKAKKPKNKQPKNKKKRKPSEKAKKPTKRPPLKPHATGFNWPPFSFPKACKPKDVIDNDSIKSSDIKIETETAGKKKGARRGKGGKGGKVATTRPDANKLKRKSPQGLEVKPEQTKTVISFEIKKKPTNALKEAKLILVSDDKKKENEEKEIQCLHKVAVDLSFGDSSDDDDDKDDGKDKGRDKKNKKEKQKRKRKKSGKQQKSKKKQQEISIVKEGKEITAAFLNDVFEGKAGAPSAIKITIIRDVKKCKKKSLHVKLSIKGCAHSKSSPSGQAKKPKPTSKPKKKKKARKPSKKQPTKRPKKTSKPKEKPKKKKKRPSKTAKPTKKPKKAKKPKNKQPKNKKKRKPSEKAKKPTKRPPLKPHATGFNWPPFSFPKACKPKDVIDNDSIKSSDIKIETETAGKKKGARRGKGGKGGKVATTRPDANKLKRKSPQGLEVKPEQTKTVISFEIKKKPTNALKEAKLILVSDDKKKENEEKEIQCLHKVAVDLSFGDSSDDDDDKDDGKDKGRDKKNKKEKQKRKRKKSGKQQKSKKKQQEISIVKEGKEITAAFLNDVFEGKAGAPSAIKITIIRDVKKCKKKSLHVKLSIKGCAHSKSSPSGQAKKPKPTSKPKKKKKARKPSKKQPTKRPKKTSKPKEKPKKKKKRPSKTAKPTKKPKKAKKPKNKQPKNKKKRKPSEKAKKPTKRPPLKPHATGFNWPPFSFPKACKPKDVIDNDSIKSSDIKIETETAGKKKGARRGKGGKGGKVATTRPDANKLKRKSPQGLEVKPEQTKTVISFEIKKKPTNALKEAKLILVSDDKKKENEEKEIQCLHKVAVDLSFGDSSDDDDDKDDGKDKGRDKKNKKEKQKRKRKKSGKQQKSKKKQQEISIVKEGKEITAAFLNDVFEGKAGAPSAIKITIIRDVKKCKKKSLHVKLSIKGCAHSKSSPSGQAKKPKPTSKPKKKKKARKPSKKQPTKRPKKTSKPKEKPKKKKKRPSKTAKPTKKPKKAKKPKNKQPKNKKKRKPSEKAKKPTKRPPLKPHATGFNWPPFSFPKACKPKDVIDNDSIKSSDIKIETETAGKKKGARRGKGGKGGKVATTRPDANKLKRKSPQGLEVKPEQTKTVISFEIKKKPTNALKEAKLILVSDDKKKENEEKEIQCLHKVAVDLSFGDSSDDDDDKDDGKDKGRDKKNKKEKQKRKRKKSGKQQKSKKKQQEISIVKEGKEITAAFLNDVFEGKAGAPSAIKITIIRDVKKCKKKSLHVKLSIKGCAHSKSSPSGQAKKPKPTSKPKKKKKARKPSKKQPTKRPKKTSKPKEKPKKKKKRPSKTAKPTKKPKKAKKPKNKQPKNKKKRKPSEKAKKPTKRPPLKPHATGFNWPPFSFPKACKPKDVIDNDSIKSSDIKIETETAGKKKGARRGKGGKGGKVATTRPDANKLKRKSPQGLEVKPEQTKTVISFEIKKKPTNALKEAKLILVSDDKKKENEEKEIQCLHKVAVDLSFGDDDDDDDKDDGKDKGRDKKNKKEKQKRKRKKSGKQQKSKKKQQEISIVKEGKEITAAFLNDVFEGKAGAPSAIKITIIRDVKKCKKKSLHVKLSIKGCAHSKSSPSGQAKKPKPTSKPKKKKKARKPSKKQPTKRPKKTSKPKEKPKKKKKRPSKTAKPTKKPKKAKKPKNKQPKNKKKRKPSEKAKKPTKRPPLKPHATGFNWPPFSFPKACKPKDVIDNDSIKSSDIKIETETAGKKKGARRGKGGKGGKVATTRPDANKLKRKSPQGLEVKPEQTKTVISFEIKKKPTNALKEAKLILVSDDKKKENEEKEIQCLHQEEQQEISIVKEGKEITGAFLNDVFEGKAGAPSSIKITIIRDAKKCSKKSLHVKLSIKGCAHSKSSPSPKPKTTPKPKAKPTVKPTKPLTTKRPPLKPHATGFKWPPFSFPKACKPKDVIDNDSIKSSDIKIETEKKAATPPDANKLKRKSPQGLEVKPEQTKTVISFEIKKKPTNALKEAKLILVSDDKKKENEEKEIQCLHKVAVDLSFGGDDEAGVGDKKGATSKKSGKQQQPISIVKEGKEITGAFLNDVFEGKAGAPSSIKITIIRDAKKCQKKSLHVKLSIKGCAHSKSSPSPKPKTTPKPKAKPTVKPTKPLTTKRPPLKPHATGFKWPPFSFPKACKPKDVIDNDSIKSSDIKIETEKKAATPPDANKLKRKSPQGLEVKPEQTKTVISFEIKKKPTNALKEAKLILVSDDKKKENEEKEIQCLHKVAVDLSFGGDDEAGVGDKKGATSKKSGKQQQPISIVKEGKEITGAFLNDVFEGKAGAPSSIKITIIRDAKKCQKKSLHVKLSIKGCAHSKSSPSPKPKTTPKPKAKPTVKPTKPLTTKRPPLKPHATGFKWPPFSFPKACKPKDVIDNDSIKSSDIKIETEKKAATPPDANKLKRKSPQGLEVKPEQTKTVISFEIKKKPTNALKEAKLILVSDDKKKENEEKEIQCLHKVAVDLSFGGDDEAGVGDKKGATSKKSGKQQQPISIVKEGKEITGAFLNDVFEGKAGAPSSIKITIIRDAKKCQKKSLHVKLSIKGCAHSKSSPSPKPKTTPKPKAKPTVKPTKPLTTKRPPLKPHATGFKWPPFSFPKACKPKDVIDNDSIKSSDIKIETEKKAATPPDANKLKRKSPQGLEVKPEQTKTVISFEIKKKPTNALKEAKLILVSDDKKKENEEKEIQCLHKVAVDLSFGGDDEAGVGDKKGATSKKSGKQQQPISIVKEGKEITGAFLNDVFEGKAGAPSSIKITIIRDAKKCQKKSLHVKLSIKGCAHSKSSPSPKPKTTPKPKAKPTVKPTKPLTTKRPPLKPHATGFKWPPFSFPKACKPKDVIDNDSIKSSDIKIETEKKAATPPDANKLKRKSPQGLEVKPEQTKTVISFEIKKKPTNALKEAKLILVSDDKKKENEEKEIQCLHKVAVDLSFGGDDEAGVGDKKGATSKKSGKQQQPISIVKEGKEITGAFLNDVFEGKAGAPSSIKITIIRDAKKCQKKSLHVKLSIKGCAHSKSSPSPKPKTTPKPKAKPTVKPTKPLTTKRPPLKPHATGFKWPPFSFPKACKPKDVIDNDSIKSSDIKIETEKKAATPPDANKLKRKSPQGLEVKPEQTKTVISFEIKKKPTNALKEAKLILVSDDKKKENEEKEIQCLHKVAVDLSFGGDDEAGVGDKKGATSKKSGKQQQPISIVKEGKEITGAFLNDVFEGKAGAPSSIKITIIRDAKKCQKKSLHVKLSIKGCAHSKSSPSPKPKTTPKPKAKPTVKPTKPLTTKRPPLKPHATGFKWPPFSFPKACKPKDVIDNDSIKSSDIKIETEKKAATPPDANKLKRKSPQGLEVKPEQTKTVISFEIKKKPTNALKEAKLILVSDDKKKENEEKEIQCLHKVAVDLSFGGDDEAGVGDKKGATSKKSGKQQQPISIVKEGKEITGAFLNDVFEGKAGAPSSIKITIIRDAKKCQKKSLHVKLSIKGCAHSKSSPSPKPKTTPKPKAKPTVKPTKPLTTKRPPLKPHATGFKWPPFSFPKACKPKDVIDNDSIKSSDIKIETEKKAATPPDANKLKRKSPQGLEVKPEQTKTVISFEIKKKPTNALKEAKLILVSDDKKKENEEKEIQCLHKVAVDLSFGGDDEAGVGDKKGATSKKSGKQQQPISIVKEGKEITGAFLNDVFEGKAGAPSSIKITIIRDAKKCQKKSLHVKLSIKGCAHSKSSPSPKPKTTPKPKAKPTVKPTKPLTTKRPPLKPHATGFKWPPFSFPKACKPKDVIDNDSIKSSDIKIETEKKAATPPDANKLKRKSPQGLEVKPEQTKTVISFEIKKKPTNALKEAKLILVSDDKKKENEEKEIQCLHKVAVDLSFGGDDEAGVGDKKGATSKKSGKQQQPISIVKEGKEITGAFLNDVFEGKAGAPSSIKITIIRDAKKCQKKSLHVKLSIKGCAHSKSSPSPKPKTTPKPKAKPTVKPTKPLTTKRPPLKPHATGFKWPPFSFPKACKPKDVIDNDSIKSSDIKIETEKKAATPPDANKLKRKSPQGLEVKPEQTKTVISFEIKKKPTNALKEAKLILVSDDKKKENEEKEIQCLHKVAVDLSFGGDDEAGVGDKKGATSKKSGKQQQPISIVKEGKEITGAFLNDVFEGKAGAPSSIKITIIRDAKKCQKKSLHVKLSIKGCAHSKSSPSPKPKTTPKPKAKPTVKPTKPLTTKRPPLKPHATGFKWPPFSFPKACKPKDVIDNDSIKSSDIKIETEKKAATPPDANKLKRKSPQGLEVKPEQTKTVISFEIKKKPTNALKEAKLILVSDDKKKENEEKEIQCLHKVAVDLSFGGDDEAGVGDKKGATSKKSGKQQQPISIVKEGKEITGAFLNDVFEGKAGAPSSIKITIIRDAKKCQKKSLHVKLSIKGCAHSKSSPSPKPKTTPKPKAKPTVKPTKPLTTKRPPLKPHATGFKWPPFSFPKACKPKDVIDNDSIKSSDIKIETEKKAATPPDANKLKRKSPQGLEVKPEQTKTVISFEIKKKPTNALKEAKLILVSDDKKKENEEKEIQCLHKVAVDLSFGGDDEAGVGDKKGATSKKSGKQQQPISIVKEGKEITGAFLNDVFEGKAGAPSSIKITIIRDAKKCQKKSLHVKLSIKGCAHSKSSPSPKPKTTPKPKAKPTVKPTKPLTTKRPPLKPHATGFKWPPFSFPKACKPKDVIDNDSIKSSDIKIETEKKAATPPDANKLKRKSPQGLEVKPEQTKTVISFEIKKKPTNALKEAKLILVSDDKKKENEEKEIQCLHKVAVDLSFGGDDEAGVGDKKGATSKKSGKQQQPISIVKEGKEITGAFLNDVFEGKAGAPSSIKITIIRDAKKCQKKSLHVKLSIKGCAHSKSSPSPKPKTTPKPKAKPTVKPTKPLTTKRPPLKPHATGFKWPPFSFPKACKPKDVIDNDSIKSSDIKIETEKKAATPPDANKLKRKSPQGLEVKPEQTKTVISFEIKKKPTNALKEAKLILVSDDKKKENEEKEIQCLHKVAVDLSFGGDDEAGVGDKKGATSKKSGKQQQPISIVKEGKEITGAFLNDVFEGKAGAPSSIKITIIRDAKKCQKKSLHVKLSILGCLKSNCEFNGKRISDGDIISDGSGRCDYKFCDDGDMKPALKCDKFSNWTSCSSCGPSLQKQYRRCHLTNGIPANDAREKINQTCLIKMRTKPCFIKPCPVDCEMTPWTQWSPCSKSCGFQLSSRTRTIKKQPKYDGKACPKVLEAVKVCPLPPCKKVCDPDQEMKDCFNDCKQLCEGMSSYVNCTMDKCTRGCGCSKGKYLNHEGKCVPKNRCGCPLNKATLGGRTIPPKQLLEDKNIQTVPITKAMTTTPAPTTVKMPILNQNIFAPVAPRPTTKFYSFAIAPVRFLGVTKGLATKAFVANFNPFNMDSMFGFDKPKAPTTTQAMPTTTTFKAMKLGAQPGNTGIHQMPMQPPAMGPKLMPNPLPNLGGMKKPMMPMKTPVKPTSSPSKDHLLTPGASVNVDCQSCHCFGGQLKCDGKTCHEKNKGDEWSSWTKCSALCNSDGISTRFCIRGLCAGGRNQTRTCHTSTCSCAVSQELVQFLLNQPKLPIRVWQDVMENGKKIQKPIQTISILREGGKIETTCGPCTCSRGSLKCIKSSTCR